MHNNARTSRWSVGFTLIELLVVIAVIAILAALLLPALSRAKDQARTVECLNNLKQLHLAWQMYETDHGRLPRNWDYGLGFAPPEANWVSGVIHYDTMDFAAGALSDSTNTALLFDEKKTMLAPYLKSAAIFKCPSDKSYAIRGGVHFARVRSYSINGYVGESARVTDASRRHYYKSEEFIRPGASDTFTFLDEHEDSINDGFFLVGHRDDESLGWNDIPGSRHRRRANFAFADGHVETHRWRDSRTILPISRVRQFGINQPNNPDVKWMHQHATATK